MTEQIFSQKRAEQNLARAYAMDMDRFLLDDIAQSFADRLAFMTRKFEKPCEYSQCPPIALKCSLDAVHARRLEEVPSGCDLIIAPLILDLAEDPLSLLVHLRSKLAPDGMLLTACLGEQNLADLRARLMELEMAVTGGAAARFHPRMALQDLARLAVAAGLALPVADKEILKVRYQNMFRLARDLRAHGLNICLHDVRPMRRDVVALANQQFFGPKSQALTFEILYLAAFAPSPDQPKPKAPGSAQVSMAQALTPKKDQR